MSFFHKFFKAREKRGSKVQAKQRLQLVLVEDRLNLSTSLMSHLKDDLLGVVAKYLPIDKSEMDVSLHRDGNKTAIIANIPVMNGKKRAM